MASRVRTRTCEGCGARITDEEAEAIREADDFQGSVWCDECFAERGEDAVDWSDDEEDG